MSKRAKKEKRKFDTTKYYALDNKINLELQKTITPLTQNQEIVFKTFNRKNLFLHGLAGTGKSFIALYLAFKEIFSNSSPYKKIIIVRSLVQTRDMGHLPGSDKEKMKVYEAPYINICSELFGKPDSYFTLKQKGFIEFMSTSFIRGITLNNAIVLVDECQNMISGELHSIITRIGDFCKIIFAGDIKQTDLNKRKEFSGILDFIKIIKQMNCFEFIEFGEGDIVRSHLVKQYIITKNRLEENGTIRVNLV